MQKIVSTKKIDYLLVVPVIFLIVLSLFVLNSIASSLFPLYFLYVFLGIFFFYIFSKIDFDILSLFSNHLYVASIVLLILPLLIGQVTRGAIRWIPIGALTIQPAEIVRPFLIVFFANFITSEKLNLKRLGRAIALLLLPTFLILVQPSLGVSVLTVISFIGVLLAANINKKYILYGSLILLMLLPLSWFVMAPYQKDRVRGFINPEADPAGTGYNSIQSMISVGSGKLTGRGLGKGVQTQLAFLPERHTDFIFAAVSEELGLIGAMFLLTTTIFIFFRLTKILENAVNPAARAYMSGFILSFLVQVVIHVGMNMGLFPITGLPYPLVSAGGSSLLATMTSLGIAVAAKKKV